MYVCRCIRMCVTQNSLCDCGNARCSRMLMRLLLHVGLGIVYMKRTCNHVWEVNAERRRNELLTMFDTILTYLEWRKLNGDSYVHASSVFTIRFMHKNWLFHFDEHKIITNVITLLTFKRIWMNLATLKKRTYILSVHVITLSKPIFNKRDLSLRFFKRN